MKTTRPLITEKSMALAREGWYSFIVPVGCRKEDIAKEIGNIYTVTVRDVRTMRRMGKVRRSGRKMLAHRRPDWKKAIVRLSKGQSIPVFDIGEQPQQAK
ncbi:MAG TPA: 50S ribosomal protein L23 [Patescibacteria group bacterium]|nr:50S ribosomal protein L23 [Patescibacteria group bacterium]